MPKYRCSRALYNTYTHTKIYHSFYHRNHKIVHYLMYKSSQLSCSKASLKRCVFNSFLKESRVSEHMISRGSWFQSSGAALLNARSPWRTVLDLGTISRGFAEDLSCLDCLAGCTMSIMYLGALPYKAL